MAETPVRCIQPPLSWLKLNTDGALNPALGKGGAGSLLRDSVGRWIGGFSYNIDLCGAIEAELWEIIKGLEFAWQNNCSRVIMETDC